MVNESPIARFVLIAASFVIVIAGMRAAETLLVPFLLSLFIAIICSPPLVWMKNRGVPGGLSIGIIVLVVVFVGVLIGAVVGSSVNDFRGDLPQYEERMGGLLIKLQAFLDARGLDLSAGMLRENFNPSVILSFAGNTLASFGNMMTNAFLILLTVIFILAEEVRFSEKMKFANDGAVKSLDSMHRFTKSVNQYMALKTGVSLFTGLVAMTILWLIGVDYPVLWGLLAFLLNFIPTLGSILAAVPPVLLALIQLGVGEAAITAVAYVCINVIVGNVIEPRVMGKGLDLSALVVFLSLVFWGWVLGPVGMLLSVPLTITVKIALENFDDTRWIAVILGSGKEISN